MRKVALLLCLCTLLCCFLTSCGAHKLSKEINDDNRYRLHTKMDTSQFQFTYEHEGQKVSVYYLGRVSNVPFASSEELEHEKGKTERLVYKKDDFSQSDFAASKSLAISRVISNDIEKTITYTAANGTVGLATVSSNPTVDRRYNISEALKSDIDTIPPYAFADSYETAREFVESKRISNMHLSYKTGIFSQEKFLRISLFGDCDFYAFTVYNSQTNTVSVTYDLAIVPSSLVFNWETSETAGFEVSEQNKGCLRFDTSVLSSGSILDTPETYTITYVPNGGTFATAPTVTYTLAGVTLSTPQLAYFDFGGWYFDEGLTQPATNDTVRQKAENVTLYAKWNTQTDVSEFAGYTGVTSNIKGEETGKINSMGVSQDKIQAYIEAGYRVRVTYYYTYSVPFAYEGNDDADPADLKVQIGFASDTSGSNFIEMASYYHSNVAPGATGSHSLVFEASLSDLMSYYVSARTVILSNDDSVLGICGKDAGTYSGLKMVIEYIK